MGTRHEGSVPRAVRRAVTAVVEYGVARAGTTAVRALDRDVIGQAHHPRGTAGSVTGWMFAHRPSNRQRSRCPGWPSDPGEGFGRSDSTRTRRSLRRHTRRQFARVLDRAGRAPRRVAPTAGTWRACCHRVPTPLPRSNGGHVPRRRPRNRGPAAERRLCAPEHRDPPSQPSGGLRPCHQSRPRLGRAKSRFRGLMR